MEVVVDVAAAVPVAVAVAVAGFSVVWLVLEAPGVDDLLLTSAFVVVVVCPSVRFFTPALALDSAPNDKAAKRLSNSSPVPAAAQNFMYRSTILS